MDPKDTYTEVFLKSAEKNTTEEEIKRNKIKWWWNIRERGGLRLTEEAIEFIETEAKIKTYKIDFPPEFSFTPQILIWLDRFIESPYFITKKSITVLKEKSAFELYLFSGDVRKMGYSKALSKRLNQN
jgi:hypothetical protein